MNFLNTKSMIHFNVFLSLSLSLSMATNLNYLRTPRSGRYLTCLSSEGTNQGFTLSIKYPFL